MDIIISRLKGLDLQRGPCSVSLCVFSVNFADKVNVGIIFFRVVEFASFNDMQRALKRLDGTELLGKRLRLTEVRVFVTSRLSGDVIWRTGKKNFNAVSHNRARP